MSKSVDIKACQAEYAASRDKLLSLLHNRVSLSFLDYIHLRYGLHTWRGLERWAVQKYYVEYLDIILRYYGSADYRTHELDGEPFIEDSYIDGFPPYKV